MFIYLLKNEDTSYYKIGIAKDVSRRIKQLQTGSAERIILISSYRSKYYSKIEARFHAYYEYCNKLNEWFELNLEEEVRFLDLCRDFERAFIELDKDIS